MNDNVPNPPHDGPAGSPRGARAQDQTGQGSLQFGDNARIGGDVFIGDKIIQAPPVGAAALRQLPPPPADFTGRAAELAELRAAVAAGGALVGLRGPNGVGKTALALVLAHAFGAVYPDAQLYLDLRGAADPQPLAPTEALAHCIHAFEPTIQLPEGLPERQAVYRSLLAGKRALVLLDNARDRAQVEPLLPPPGCLVLLTSIQRFVLPGLAARDLDRLPRAEAAALLLKIAPRIGGQADEIARLCGDLPLALRLAGSALAESADLEVDDYLAQLRDETTRLAALEEAVRAVSVSCHLLAPEPQAAWPPLAVFAGGFDRAAAAAVLDREEGAAGAALSALLRFSLLDYDAGRRRYRLHDLARSAAAARLPPAERQAAQRRHALHYRDVLAAATTLYARGQDGVLSGLALFDLERANIEAGQAWAAAYADEDDEAARLCSAYPEAGIHVLSLRQTPRERIPWLERAVLAARRLQADRAQATHLGNLGSAYLALGDARRAIAFFEQSLRTAGPGDPAGEGAVLGNLGLAYAALGDTRRAIGLYERHLASARQAGDRRGEANAIGNLGNAHAALGDARQAIVFYDQQLALVREIGDRRGEANTLGNLGRAYADLGETRRAMALYEQQRALAREIGDRRSEANALANLGLAHAALGDARQAIGLYQQHLALARAIGDRHGEGAALGNLGTAYADLGDTRQAIEFHEQCLAIAHEIGDRRGQAAALGNLGIAYRRLGQPRRAIEFHAQDLALTRELGDRRAEGQALGSLAIAHAELGETAQAIEFFEQQLRITREIGDRHGEGLALGNLGNAYAQLGQPQRALELYEQRLALARELGDRRGEGYVLANLGNVYSALGQHQRAMELYEQRLAIARELGDRRGESETSWNLGVLLAEAGELERAIALLQQRVEYEREAGHPEAEALAARVEALRAGSKRSEGSIGSEGNRGNRGTKGSRGTGGSRKAAGAKRPRRSSRRKGAG